MRAQLRFSRRCDDAQSSLGSGGIRFLSVGSDDRLSTRLRKTPEYSGMQRPGMKLVNGVPMLDFLADKWSCVEQLQARSDDLVIATYPKAGTTWMQEIVDLVINATDLAHNRRATIDDRMIFMEWSCGPGEPPELRSGVELLDEFPSPRVIKTHVPYKLFPSSFWAKDCKVIYVARNAKDNAVSYFHFDRMNRQQPEPGSWEEYLPRFVAGSVPWGSWYDHVTGWWNARENHRILYFFYEDMKENPLREVSRVADFIERPLSERQLQEVVRLSSFSVMKNNPMSNYSHLPPALMDQTVSPFMRKGEVGDWKNHFSASQLEEFEQDYSKKMPADGPSFRDTLP
uniref:Sulfotransferase n=2 Tax=Petromyzon marinus TaxID=7757 RepID=A0AAJ7WNA3_PETMA|nr:sulfotransferase 1C1-like [Petromyzon marinus]